MSSDSCFQRVNCTDVFSFEECVTIQSGAVPSIIEEGWDDTCQCKGAVVGAVPNQTCANQMISYTFKPDDAYQSEVCFEKVSKAETGVIATIVVIYFAVPAFCIVLVLIWRHRARVARREKRFEPSSSDTRPAHPTARVTFENVCYSIGEKQILKNVSATLEPGRLTAIMGPSGCGKSTLLDILAYRGRGAGPGVTGTILINGKRRDGYWKRISAYVEQFDALFPHLTVREMLTFSAELRFPTQSRVVEAVANVLAQLELEHVADTRIGDKYIKGISGGQARRVTVGVELLAEPSVLFLDEPTSGLDSTSAKSLVEILKNLAHKNGVTVACTIHQPRSSTFKLFDDLLLMKSGEVAYYGSLQGIVSYLDTSLNVQVPRSVNLADFVVDLTYDKDETDLDNTQSTGPNLDVNALVEAWKKRSYQVHVGTPSDDLIKYMKASGAYEGSRYVRSLVDQVYILLRRSFTNVGRNTGYFTAVGLQSVQFLFYGLLFVGLRIYPNAAPQDFSANGGAAEVGMDITNLYKKNFIFQVMNTVCIVESVVIASAFLEKTIFLREYAAGSYSVLAYHLQWYIRLTTDAIWKGGIAAILSYFFPPMRMEADAFFFFWATLSVVSTVGSSLAFLMASAVVDAEGAANIHNTVIGFMGTYAGFFLPSLLIPIFTLWAYYLSFLKYSFEALELNEWSGCASYFMLTEVLSVDTTLNRWTNLLILMAYPVAFHIIALICSLANTGALKASCKRDAGSSIEQRPVASKNTQAAAADLADPADTNAKATALQVV